MEVAAVGIGEAVQLGSRGLGCVTAGYENADRLVDAAPKLEAVDALAVPGEREVTIEDEVGQLESEGKAEVGCEIDEGARVRSIEQQ